jgi:hypothetical protein
MGLKEFAIRNKAPLAQLLLAAVLVIAGVAMLQMSVSNYKPPKYEIPEKEAQNYTVPGSSAEGELKNCTPLYNATRKVSYEYEIYSKSPDGPLRMKFSYSYIGEEALFGVRADVVEMKANTTMQNLTFDPVMKAWLDYETGKCLKAEISMGKGYNYPMSCQDANFGMPVVTCEEQLAGLTPGPAQEVKVPAGAFNATRYDKGKDSIWLAKGIPVPVKFTFIQSQETAVAELIAYTEKR